jgi:signal recognition particle receptor subunit beta
LCKQYEIEVREIETTDIIFLGDQESGKTSTIQNLLQLPFNLLPRPKNDSTKSSTKRPILLTLEPSTSGNH